MKKIHLVLAFLFCLAMPTLSNAQFGGPSGPGSGLPITYTGANTVGQLLVNVNTSPSTYYWVFNTGDSHVFPAPVSVNLSFNYPIYGVGGSITIPIATINGIAMGGSQTFTPSSCYTYTISKGFGYSVVGGTYNYTLSISVHNSCL